MKTLTCKIMTLVLLVPCIAMAGDGLKGRFTKEKKISKAYYVNADAGLDIDNQFGSIYVTTWDEDKTQIDVVIRVSGNNEEKVDKKLASIDVDIEALKSLVSAKTHLGSVSGNNMSFEINYTVRIPKRGSIDLKNQYGPIITGKIFGKSRIDCQYGDITIDELNNDINNIKLQYSGSGRINFIKNCDVDAQYSSLNITKAGNVKLKAQYSPITLGDIGNIEYRNEYSNLNVKSANNANGSGEYSQLKFGDVSGNFNASCNYGEVKIAQLDNSAKNVSINAAYTNITVNYREGFAFDFEFHLEYGSLRGAGGFKFTEKTDKDNKAHYKGYNGRAGANRVFIKSEYGDINLGRA